jgi:uncharacterized protein YhjY with autotransporter beta-barrel domain
MRAGWAILLLVAGLVTSNSALASSRQVAVFTDGRAIPLSGGKAAFSCEDEGLAFVFTETINGSAPPQVLTLEESEQESGEGNVRVEITQTCGEGEAIFDYEHVTAGASSDDLSISPERFSITVPTTQGASASRTVSYQALDDDESEDEESFTLIGNQIVFFVDNTAGQASSRRDLLEVRIPANSENVVEPEDLPDGTTAGERNAVDRLNEACLKAEPGSDFAATCQEIDVSQDNEPPETRGQQARRIAMAVDPREVTEATVAALETVGRVQHENLLSRLVSLRNGSRGVEVSGLRLAMNGHSLGTSWIQDYLDAEEEAGGGSRLLSEKWGIFLNGSISIGDQEFPQGSGYDFDIYDLTGGVDYRFNNGFIVGGAIGLTQFESDIDADGGTLDSDSVTLQSFGTYNLTENFYIDATAAYARGDIDQVRTIDLSGIGSLSKESVSGSTDSTQMSTSVTLNYQTSLGGGWSMTNYGSLYFADNEVDVLTEAGNGLALSFEKREFDSLLSTLGLRVSRVFNFQNGVMTAFGDFAYKHESKDALDVNTRFAAVNAPGPAVRVADPDKDFGSVGAGVSWVFRDGNQLFVKLNTLVLDDARSRSSIYVGGRLEF